MLVTVQKVMRKQFSWHCQYHHIQCTIWNCSRV